MHIWISSLDFFSEKKTTEHLFRHVPSHIILSHKPSSVIIAQPPYPLIVFCYNYARLYFIIIIIIIYVQITDIVKITTQKRGLAQLLL